VSCTVRLASVPMCVPLRLQLHDYSQFTYVLNINTPTYTNVQLLAIYKRRHAVLKYKQVEYGELLGLLGDQNSTLRNFGAPKFLRC